MKCIACTRPRAAKPDGSLYSQCESCRKLQKKWKDDNKERIKEYYQANKQAISEKQREYIKTPQGRKVYRISTWKYYGLIHDNYDELYEIYINTTNCQNCSVLLTEDKKTTSTTRCMDHDHNTGLFRMVVCNKCNTSRELRQYSPIPGDTVTASQASAACD